MAGTGRAFFGYLFLVVMVRLVGRRPGRQITPFEVVIVFFVGGLALTAMVGDDGSFTNAIGQIIAISVAHYLVTWTKARSPRIARCFDGTPLTLLSDGMWHTLTLKKTHMQDVDVASAAREQNSCQISDMPLLTSPPT